MTSSSWEDVSEPQTKMRISIDFTLKNLMAWHVPSDHHQPSPDTLLRVFLDPIKGWTVSI